MPAKGEVSQGFYITVGVILALFVMALIAGFFGLGKR